MRTFQSLLELISWIFPAIIIVIAKSYLLLENPGSSQGAGIYQLEQSVPNSLPQILALTLRNRPPWPPSGD